MRLVSFLFRWWIAPFRVLKLSYAWAWSVMLRCLIIVLIWYVWVNPFIFEHVTLLVIGVLILLWLLWCLLVWIARRYVLPKMLMQNVRSQRHAEGKELLEFASPYAKPKKFRLRKPFS